MIEVGKETAPLVEAWRRFSLGNAAKADFELILADLLDTSLHGKVISFAAFLDEKNTLDNYPLYCALVAAKQELGARVVRLLNYTEDQTLEARRFARMRLKESVFD